MICMANTLKTQIFALSSICVCGAKNEMHNGNKKKSQSKQCLRRKRFLGDIEISTESAKDA